MAPLGKIALAAGGAVLIYFGMRAVGFAFRMWRVGLAARGVLAALLGTIYTLSPVDAVPDVFVGIGWVDDLIVLGITAMYVWRVFAQLQGPRQAGGPNFRPARPTVVPQLPPR